MSITVEYLSGIGRVWLSQIRYLTPAKGWQAAKEMAARINALLKRDHAPGITVSLSPFQFYELLVKKDGTPYKYDTFIANFAGDMLVTEWLLDFIEGNRDIDDFSGFEDLPLKKRDLAQAFVAIVFIAEIGRHNTDSAALLYDYLIDILKGRDTWSNLKTRFPAALTYAEDNRTDYRPPEDEDFLN